MSTPWDEIGLHVTYVTTQNKYLDHKLGCYRPGCGINAHGDGCATERKLYDAYRDALRALNHATPPEPQR